MNSKYFHIGLVLWIFAVVPLGFSESFPSRPTAGEMEDIVEQGIESGNAVIERDTVVSRNQSFLPYCGHGQSYFASLQTELEYLPPSYVDHENGPLTDEEDDFLYFTIDNWRAAAGLNVSGFRRSTDGTTFYYGKMQAGDIIGSWIFEDLQKGFGALKWTIKPAVLSGTRKFFALNAGDQPEGERDLAHMIPLCEAGYAAASPVSSTSVSAYSKKFRVADEMYDVSLERSMGNITISGISTAVPHSYELYFLAKGHDDWLLDYSDTCTWEFTLFGDFTVAEGVLSILDTGVESSDSAHSWGGFGSTVQPSWGGNPAIGEVIWKGYDGTIKSFLLKWNFTNE